MLRSISPGAASAALFMVLMAAPVQSATLNATAATIQSAWSKAKPGDTIKLSGTFAYTRLQYKDSNPPVTLDATNAVFTDSLNLTQVNGLNVVGGKFDATGGPTKYGRSVVVYGGSNIAFSGSTFIGAGQQGIAFNDTVNVQVRNSTFSGLYVGIALTRVTGAVLTKNKITKSIADGIDIADSHNVDATYNSCTGGTPGAGVHPDCIQLWSIAGHAVQSDIYVAHNSATGPTQGFTSFTPENGGGLRIQFVYNTVNTNYVQGIACYACVDSNISYNTVTTMAGAGHLTNINVIGGANNIVIGNSIGAFAKPAQGLATDPNGALVDPSGLAALSSDLSGTVGGVPEPASWLMMIAGFGIVGAAVRRSRQAAFA